MYSYYNQQEVVFEQQSSMVKSKKTMYANEQPMSVMRRNERERNRVRQVNDGYVTLRERIPQDIVTTNSNGGRGASKKLSKVDTLRLALVYIRQLKEKIGEYDSDASSSNCESPEPNMFYNYQSSSSEYSQYSQSSSSPTPSQLSENSSDGHYFQQQQQHHHHIELPQFNTQMYNCTINEPSEDEELLDCISYWQDQSN